MSTTTAGTGGAASREMPLIHRIFRHQFGELRELVAEVGSADPARTRAVGGHLSFMLDGLHYHHTTEDDYVWPHLRDRAGIDGRLATRMEEQHREIDAAVTRVREASAAWTAAPAPQSADELVGRLDDFMQVVVTHLDEEERDVVPLIDRHLTEAEWELLGRRSFEKFTPQQRWIAMGQMLEVATPEEAEMMLGKLPAPVRVLWRLVGRRTYRRYVEQVRGGDHLAIAVRRRAAPPTAVTPTTVSATRRDAGLQKAAALLSLLLGLGFGVPAAVGTVYFARHGSVWTFLGFPTYGEGPFTAVGIPDSAPLQLGFVVVCAAEVVVGVLLWRRPRAGAQISIALLPFELAYWIGFALPFGPVLGVLRTLAVMPAFRDSTAPRKGVRA